jgi:hypothetical protein
MLDRSHTANLFSEHDQDPSELAGDADATVEHPAASPDADAEQAQRLAAPSTTAPRPRRRRPARGRRRGAVPAEPRVAKPKPQVSLPTLPPRARRALPFAPLGLVLLMLLTNQAGCSRQVAHTSTHTSSTPAAIHKAPGAQPARRSASKRMVRARAQHVTPHVLAAVATTQASAASDRTPTLAAPVRPPVHVTSSAPAIAGGGVPVSPSAAPTGSPTPEERGVGDEFGFER